jgi:putative ABC transport system permease protein
MSLVACSSGYLSAIGARLVSGRAVETDEAGSNSVVISRSVASHLFRGKEPMGLTLPTRVPGSPTPPRVVGVVDDVRYTGLAEQTRGAIYVPWNQFPLNSVHLVVRANGDPRTLVPSIRDVIHRLDPDQPIANVTLLQDTLASSIADRRLHAFLALSFAALGFVVALVGLVAALGRSVIERRRELAVRAALGATPARTLMLVMSHATRLVVSGIALGSIGAVAAARALGARLFGVTPYDPSTYSTVADITGLIALLACLVPAYRATTLDPTVLLRTE